jgi:hypothetical protein
VNNRRAALLSALVAAGLGLAACGTTSPSANSPAPTTTAPLAPADAFSHALAALKTTGFDTTISHPAQSATIKGTVDYAHQSAAETATVDLLGQTFVVAATKVGNDLWLKIDLGDLTRAAGIDKSTWYLVDPSKLGSDSLPFDPAGAEPLAIGALFTSVSNVQRTDATHLTGVVDLTKATGPQSPGADTLTQAGAAASTVAFTATLDGQGRLTEVKATPSDDDLAFDITITNYGSPTAITAPAGAVPAPAGVYTALSGLGQ